MNQFKAFILLAAVTLLYMSAASKDVMSEGLTPGDLAPRIVEKNMNISFNNQNGRYTLLNFWAAYDANSRMQNVELNNAVAKTDSKIVMHSISIDRSRAIFDGAVRMDNLNKTTQHIAVAGIDSDIIRKYELDKGFANYLIDADGMIVAKNISPEDVQSIVSGL
jgi:hypothetical protein